MAEFTLEITSSELIIKFYVREKNSQRHFFLDSANSAEFSENNTTKNLLYMNFMMSLRWQNEKKEKYVINSQA